MLVCIKCNSHLWSQRFRGVCHHLFVDFPYGMPLLNASTGANEISGKSYKSREWPIDPKFCTHAEGDNIRNTWSYIFFSIPPQKKMGVSLTVPFALITGNARKKSCAVNDSSIGLLGLVSNFHIYGGAWPHEISRYYAPPRGGHASRRTSDSKYAKCGEQLVWSCPL